MVVKWERNLSGRVTVACSGPELYFTRRVVCHGRISLVERFMMRAFGVCHAANANTNRDAIEGGITCSLGVSAPPSTEDTDMAPRSNAKRYIANRRGRT